MTGNSNNMTDTPNNMNGNSTAPSNSSNGISLQSHGKKQTIWYRDIDTAQVEEQKWQRPPPFLGNVNSNDNNNKRANINNNNNNNNNSSSSSSSNNKNNKHKNNEKSNDILRDDVTQNTSRDVQCNRWTGGEYEKNNNNNSRNNNNNNNNINNIDNCSIGDNGDNDVIGGDGRNVIVVQVAEHLRQATMDNDIDDDDDNDNDNDNDDDDEAGDNDGDSLASMETLSDNVSIWIDGEKHWISGVDGKTTCADLICALLNYQSGQQQMFRDTDENDDEDVNVCNDSSEQVHAEEQAQLRIMEAFKASHYQRVSYITTNNKPQYSKQMQTVKCIAKDVIVSNANTATNNNYCGNKPNKFSFNDDNNDENDNPNNVINQSMSINTKEDCKVTSSTDAATAEISATKTATATIANTNTNINVNINTNTANTDFAMGYILPRGITAIQLATEYVIVKQHRHCEEYLDGSTKVFDVLPPRDAPHKKECELLLRRLGPAPAHINTTPQFSSLISTDKDSGMGSPVGSARSAKFRRRKHKSSQWLAHGNTLHPNLSRCSANERLMKIILAQDETIQRQLSLLREKERQIAKIEEEKHRKRERELGKNYLLETYLNGLNEAECEPEIADGEEIFIDEPYQRYAANSTKAHPEALKVTGTSTVLGGGDGVGAGGGTERIKETKKEKKKKRHKDKMDDQKRHKDDNNKKFANTAKEFFSLPIGTIGMATATAMQKDKGPETETFTKHVDAVNMGYAGNESADEETEMQIFWLEKIYTLNKQLQKEEELSAKLHAKIRKYQLKRAYQTQKEVQLEIEKLDNNLALQCSDIRKVEANLMETNEVLQKKLSLLERLSQEYLRCQQQKHEKENNAQQTNEELKVDEIEKLSELPRIAFNNLKANRTEVEKLQKLLVKPSLELQAVVDKPDSREPFKLQLSTDININAAEVKANEIQQLNVRNTSGQPQQQPQSQPKPQIQPLSTPPLRQPQKQQQQQEQEHKRQMQLHNYPITQINQNNNVTASRNNDSNISDTSKTTNNSNGSNINAINEISSSLTTTTTHIPYTQALDPEFTTTTTTTTIAGATSATTHAAFVDKNMLSSLHVQNAKTIKKQMFNSQTTTAAYLQQQKQQQQQQQQQQQEQGKTLTSPATALNTTTRALVSQFVPALVKQPANTSCMIAMNTIDISQLGTLV